MGTSAWSLVPGSAASVSITDSIVRSCWLLRMQRRSIDLDLCPISRCGWGNPCVTNRSFYLINTVKVMDLFLAFCVGFQQRILKTPGSMCSTFSKTMFAAVMYLLNSVLFSLLHTWKLCKPVYFPFCFGYLAV